MFRMKFIDGGSAIIRFPIPGVSMFLEEKVKREVSVIRFIERHTSIRVPHDLHIKVRRDLILSSSWSMSRMIRILLTH